MNNRFLNIAAALLSALCPVAALAGSSLPNVIGLSHEYFDASTENFCNPERGIFHHIEIHSNNPDTSISEWYMTRCRENGISLLFIGFVMEDFRDGSDLSDAFLRRVRSNLEILRKGGMKAVVRFSYSYDVDDLPHDVEPAVAHRHIEQLQPILRDCSDVIALLEAGFVGTWGEWYYTDHFVFKPNYRDYGLRAQLVERLAEALPSDRFISLRYPAAKLGVLQITYLDTISVQTAYNGSLQSRIGFHNDCFLANGDDMGTFSNNGNFRTYWKWESRFSPMGGETCTDANSYSEVANARQDFQAYHWSYLNEDYHRGMLDKWEADGFMPEIRRNLGYRFALTDAHVTSEARAGEPLRLVFRLTNNGWAAPYNPRPLYITLVSTSNGSCRYDFPINSVANPDRNFTIDTDPRFWMAGDTQCVDISVNLPADMAEGNYDVCLWMPDPAKTLADKPEYAIRLANAGNVWQPESGLNRLMTIKVNEVAGINAPTVDTSLSNTAVSDILGRAISPTTSGVVIMSDGSKKVY